MRICYPRLHKSNNFKWRSFFLKQHSPLREFGQHWTNPYCFWLWVGKSREGKTHKKCCCKKKASSALAKTKINFCSFFFSGSFIRQDESEFVLVMEYFSKGNFMIRREFFFIIPHRTKKKSKWCTKIHKKNGLLLSSENTVYPFEIRELWGTVQCRPFCFIYFFRN